MAKIKLLVVENQTIVRRAICMLLKSNNQFEIVGEAENGLEAVRKVKELKPDIVIMEIDLPGNNGINATKKLKELAPDMKIIILTMSSDKKLIMDAIKAGANCCVEKNSTESDLFTAINAVYRNKSYLSPSICKSVLESVQHGGTQNSDRLSLLTRGEQALLRSIANGKTKESIAEQISTTVQIIEKHLKNIMIKLDIYDIDALIKYVVAKGLTKKKGVAKTVVPRPVEKPIDGGAKQAGANEKKLYSISELMEKDVPNKSFVKHRNKGTNVEIAKDNAKGTQIYDALEIYNNAYEYLERCITLIKGGSLFNIEEGVDIVNSMLVDDKTIDLLSGKAFSVPNVKDFLVSNMVNVSIYSIKIGTGFNFSKSELADLGLAGLFHDIGMFIIPERISRKKGALNQIEKQELEKHPILSKQIIDKFGSRYQWLAEIVVQEHERFKGQGYPYGIYGHEIKEYARIIGIADTFEALTHNRQDKGRLWASKAVKKIIEEEKDHHDSKLFKILMHKLSFYPIESYVKLNSNEIAQVVSTNEKFPLQPVVQVIFKNLDCKQKEKKIIDLRTNNSLFIVEPILEEFLPTATPY